jgi:dimethylamine corrinoid protein
MDGAPLKESTVQPLLQAFLAGDLHRSVAACRALRSDGVAPERIVTEGVEAAMLRLDARCTAEQFNLLEIMLTGRAITGVMKELYPADAPPRRLKGTVVLASLEGDVHDLGKNIVKMVLTAAGYRVVDCGRDCSVDRLTETAEREGADAVGVSGLLTMVAGQVRQVRGRLAGRGLDGVRILAGGAALKQAAPEQLDVDYVAQTAFDGLHYLESRRGTAP